MLLACVKKKLKVKFLSYSPTIFSCLRANPNPPYKNQGINQARPFDLAFGRILSTKLVIACYQGPYM